MAKTLSVTRTILLVFATNILWLSNAEKVVLNSDDGVSIVPHTKHGVIIIPEVDLNTHETATMERVNTTHLNNVCNLCEDVTKGILNILQSTKLQNGIMAILHGTCSLLFNLKPKCMEAVDYYGLTFFTLVQKAQPRMICHSVHLCSTDPANSTAVLMSEDKCEVCRYVVGKALSEFKYPNKKLDIMIESVLKPSITMEHIEEKHMLNSEFAPMILAKTKHFLEEIDLCVRTHACDSRSSSEEELSSIFVS